MKSKLNSFQHLKIKPLTANHKNLMSLQVFHVPAPDLVLLSKIRKNSEYPPSASLMASPAELQHALELCNRIPLPYRPHWNAVLPHYTPHAPDIVRLGTWDMDWLCSLMKGWEVEKKKLLRQVRAENCLHERRAAVLPASTHATPSLSL